MEGDRKITLLEMGTERDDGGGFTKTITASHAAWAKRRDRGGREFFAAQQMRGEWSTRFQVRQDSRLSAIDTSWRLIDELAREYRIEYVNEPPFGRHQYWWIYAVAQG